MVVVVCVVVRTIVALGRCQRRKGTELVGAVEADLKTKVAAVIEEVEGNLATPTVLLRRSPTPSLRRSIHSKLKMLSARSTTSHPGKCSHPLYYPI